MLGSSEGWLSVLRVSSLDPQRLRCLRFRTTEIRALILRELVFVLEDFGLRSSEGWLSILKKFDNDPDNLNTLHECTAVLSKPMWINHYCNWVFILICIP